MSDDVRQSRVFAKAKANAEKYLSDPDKLRGLVNKASVTAAALGQDGPLKTIGEDFFVMIRLVRQLCSGNYTRFPARSLLLVVAGLLYFVWPVDLVADAIPLLGWIDDVTLLAFIIRSIKLDLEAFQAWEQAASEDDTDQSVCFNSY